MLIYIIIAIVIVVNIDRELFRGKWLSRIREIIQQQIESAAQSSQHHTTTKKTRQIVHGQVVESSTTTSDTFSSFSLTPMKAFLIKRIKYIFFTIIGLRFVLSSYFIINPGERWIVVVMGTMGNTIYNEGIHFKIPIISKTIKTNVQTQKFESDADSASKDLQSITTKIAINARIDEKSVQDIYRSLGGDEMIAYKVVQPSVQESVKSVTAKYTAEELITKRTSVSTEIKALLTEKLGKYGIVVWDVNIVNFNFSPDFNQAIERKVKAEQEALAEKNKLETVKYQAQQTIEQAKAQAEAIKIQVEAIQKQWGSAYVNLKWIERRDGKLPTTSLGSSNGVLLNLTQGQ